MTLSRFEIINQLKVYEIYCIRWCSNWQIICFFNHIVHFLDTIHTIDTHNCCSCEMRNNTRCRKRSMLLVRRIHLRNNLINDIFLRYPAKWTEKCCFDLVFLGLIERSYRLAAAKRPQFTLFFEAVVYSFPPRNTPAIRIPNNSSVLFVYLYSTIELVRGFITEAKWISLIKRSFCTLHFFLSIYFESFVMMVCKAYNLASNICTIK